MSGETISSLPQAITINGLTDYTIISQATGNPSAPYVSKKANALQFASINPTATVTAIEFIVAANLGYTLNTGLAGYLVAPYSGTIQSATMLANITGSIAVNIWKCSAAQFDAGATHPVAADTICGAAPPTITSGVKYNSTTLPGWTTNFVSGDVFAFNVDSTSGIISQVTLSISVLKTST